MGVITFSLAIAGNGKNPGDVLKGLWTNPLIVAFPLGLLAVGVALSLGTIRQDWPTIVLASVLKFLVFPALILGLAIWLQLDEFNASVPIKPGKPPGQKIRPLQSALHPR